MKKTKQATYDKGKERRYIAIKVNTSGYRGEYVEIGRIKRENKGKSTFR